MNEYCLEYAHDGRRWALNFFAEDDGDAEDKTQSLRASLVLLGRLDERIPAGGNVLPPSSPHS